MTSSLEINRRLRLLDVLDKIARIGLSANSMDDVLSQVLDLVLDTFDADRAWFLYPCDPSAPVWGVPMERTRPKWPGLFALGTEMPMIPEVADVFRVVLAAEGVLQYGSRLEHKMPQAIVEKFSVRTQLQIAMRPKVGPPWAFGLHHCETEVIHDDDDLRLFEAISQRLSDTLSGLISLNRLQENEAKLLSLLEQNKQVAETLKSNEAHLRLSQESGGIGTWERDLRGGYQKWSANCISMFGFPSHEQPTWEDFLSVIHPDDRSKVIEATERHIAKGVKYEPEYRVVLRSGEVRIMRSAGQVERDENGTPIIMRGIVQDVTEQKTIENALRVSEESLHRSLAQTELLLNSSLDAIVGMDQSGRITSWNKQAEKIFGFSRERALGCMLGELIVPPEQRAAHWEGLQRFLSSESPKLIGSRIEVEGLRSDGTTFPLELTLAAHKHDGEFVFSAYIRDITGRKQAEAIERAKDAAEAANAAKSKFLGSMSHELRTPLNSILGYAQLLASDAELDTESRNMAGEIEHAGRHLLALVNDIIDLARIDAGKLDLVMAATSLRLIEKECLNMSRLLAHQRGIELRTGEGDCHDVAVYADRLRLRQVLLNLLSNAIKYNRPKGTVTLSCRLRGDRVRISVIDTGLGIPKHKQTRLFGAFDRLGAESGLVEGSGIGLNIARRLVEAMSGEIGFASKEGEGSEFWVEFPAIQPSARQAPVNPTSAKVRAQQKLMSSRAVLLYVEDNPWNLRLLSKIFAKRQDIEFHHATTGCEGIEAARKLRPTLLLLDINLPDMDGYQVLKMLRADASLAHTPVIAISANAMLGDRERGLAAGFVDYLTKPINVDQLNNAVEAIVCAGNS